MSFHSFGALVVIADVTTMSSIAGRPIPASTDAVTLGSATSDDVVTCRGFPTYAPLDVSEHRQVGQSSAPTFVLVTPAVAAANRLHSTDAVAWMVRTTRDLTDSERRTLGARLRADGLRLSPPASPVSTTAGIVRRVAFATFLVLTALALIVAAAERRENRQLLRAAGVRPTDEAIAGSGRVGWSGSRGRRKHGDHDRAARNGGHACKRQQLVRCS